MKPVIAAYDLVTPFGPGMDTCWQALCKGRTAIQPLLRFSTSSFTSHQAACVTTLDPSRPDSLFFQLIDPLIRTLPAGLPDGTPVLLATTAGEIDRLERSIIGNTPTDTASSSIQATLARLAECLPFRSTPLAISGACASSTIALALAAAMIRNGRARHVLVLAADAVTEFVYAGFSTLMALDSEPARPFDISRRGLSLGEAAAWALVTSQDQAISDGLPVLAHIAGCGIANDANHMTGPSREAAGLIASIRQALSSAGLSAADIRSISAHGTGTAYNDSMEMKAFRSVFGPSPIPCCSIKGAVGHTLGAAGLVESLVAIRSLQEQTTPPTVGLQTPDADASGWVSPSPVKDDGMTTLLTTNSGFGGINAALILRAPDSGRRQAPAPAPASVARAITGEPIVSGAGWIDSTGYGCLGPNRFECGINPSSPGAIWKDTSIFPTPPRNHARFDAPSRLTCAAIALALKGAGLEYGTPACHNIGIVAASPDGSLASNIAYFADYIASGRVMARGNLFLYTLPSSPLAEAAICFGLRGPTYHMTRSHRRLPACIDLATQAVQNGDSCAMVAVIHDDTRALALLLQSAAPGIIPFSSIAEIVRLSDNSETLDGQLRALRDIEQKTHN